MLGRSSPRLGRKGMKDLGGWEAGETRGERREARCERVRRVKNAETRGILGGVCEMGQQ